IGVFGELTPPTSITAAITSKIANASFYTTLWRSVQICVSLFTLMAAVFVHPELVVKPGMEQMGAAGLVMAATLGITFSLQGTFARSNLIDRLFRVVLAAVSLYVLFSHNDILATAGSLAIVATIAYWIVYRRKLVQGEAPPVVVKPGALSSQPVNVPLGRMIG
ncbi:MAG TPA: hypothetical protein VHV56_05475, partial [Pseudolabrys sp.]|nr:hypothetical protein [Pseudolabrys sp.]